MAGNGKETEVIHSRICIDELMICLQVFCQTAQPQRLACYIPPPVCHLKMGVSYRRTQEANLLDFSPHCPFCALHQARKLYMPFLKSLHDSTRELNPCLTTLQCGRLNHYTVAMVNQSDNVPL